MILIFIAVFYLQMTQIANCLEEISPMALHWAEKVLLNHMTSLHWPPQGQNRTQRCSQALIVPALTPGRTMEMEKHLVQCLAAEGLLPRAMCRTMSILLGMATDPSTACSFDGMCKKSG